jgi:hypothetical protein
MTARPAAAMTSGRPRLSEPGVSSRVGAAAIAHRLGVG